MIEIWGRRNSSNVMTAMWCIGELGLEYKRHNVGGSFGGLDTAEYQAMNPNGVVPTINDNGRIVWESNVIARYLAATYGVGSLWPDDPYQRALADQWMDWYKTTLYPGFMAIFFNLIRTAKEKQNKAAIEEGIKATAKVLPILDRQLERNAFVAGEQLTMGDIPLGPVIYRYMNLDIERPALPGIEAWYQQLCQRPAYQKHVMIPFGKSLDDWMELEQQGADIQ